MSRRRPVAGHARRWSATVWAPCLLCASACVQTVGPAPAMAPTPQPTMRAIPSAHALQVGERRTVRAVLEDGSERIASVTIPANATIDKPAIAALEGDTVVGVAPGTATLRIVQGASHSVEVPVVVTAAAPVALSINEVVAPRLGERIAVRAVVRYADGALSDATLDADWSTPTSGRLFVNNTTETRGAVVAIMPKPATLIARLGALEARTEIAPAAGEPSGIHVRLAWAYGDHRRFGAFAHWSDGETREVSAGCLWRVPGEGPFRGVERAQPGPWLPVSAMAWNRVATCELGTTTATGTLFAP